MEGEEGFKVGKKKSITGDKGGEVDYRTKAGTAWSHNFLNQKPWHPLSYPNQRRKWIAEQTHANNQRRSEEVAREYAQEQEFFRQTALITKKEKEKLELMKAVSFMYVKPPGYNAESAKAAETADEKKIQEQDTDTNGQQDPSTSKPEESEPPVEKKKRRVKDIYGRALPTEEEFDALKNAPRLDTGLAARAKPFGIEIRNVKCLRCGKYGHQSGDRECPLKDAIMPNEENRLKRDDPLTAIQAQTEASEPLKWELKQQPGMSPPRGGFKADDPNQQIVAEDIFDEYGGFLSEAIIPELLTNISSSKPRKKSNKKKGKRSSPASPEVSDKETGHSSDDDKKRRFKKNKRRKQKYSESSSSESSERDRRRKKSNRHMHHHRNSCEASDSDEPHKSKCDLSHSHRHHRRNSSESSDSGEPYRSSKHDRSDRHSSEASDSDEPYKSKPDLSNSRRHHHMKSSKASHSDKGHKAHRNRDDRSSRHKQYHRNSPDASDETRRSKHDQSTRHRHRPRSSSEASDSEYRSKHDHWDSRDYRDRDRRHHYSDVRLE